MSAGFMAHQEAQKLLNSRGDPSNRSHVWRQLAGDFSAAAISATLVAPAVTVIDRAVVEKASLNKPLNRSLRAHTLSALMRPGRFVFSRPFAIVWTLYAATYTVANGAETLAKEFHAAATGTITFLSTMVINVPLGVWKDLRFAQFYGTGSVADKARTVVASKGRVAVPKPATAAFLVRDGLTIFGSFTLAPWLAGAIPDSMADPHSKATITQLTVPVLSQLVATPVHLLGLDLYDRQTGVAFTDRVARIRRGLASATVVRCVRIIPAFGFGCLTNIEARSFFHKALMGA